MYFDIDVVYVTTDVLSIYNYFYGRSKSKIRNICYISKGFSKKNETFKKLTIFRNAEETSINFIALFEN